MEKLSYQEIKDILESDLFSENSLGPEQWMWQDIPEDASGFSDKESELREEFIKLGDFEEVEQHGGEGEGENYYTVYHFKDHGVYIKFQGWYASYSGSEYEEMEEVFPQPVTEVKYLPKKSS